MSTRSMSHLTLRALVALLAAVPLILTACRANPGAQPVETRSPSAGSPGGDGSDADESARGERPARRSRADRDSSSDEEDPLPRNGRERAPMPPPPTGPIVITLPSRQESPYASQHGPQSRDSLKVFPAKYQRRTNPIVTIPISQPTLDETQKARNPRGWNRRYPGLEEHGFDVLDPAMQQVYDLGFREVWLWGFSGQHEVKTELDDEVMPWLSLDAHSPAMLRTWPQFCARWKAKGVRFGLWLGGVSIPNFGTTLNPEHRYLQRDDFDYVGDALANARALGFDAVGLDAFNWLLSRRDMPDWADWPDNYTGKRDRGIALALLQHLNSRPDLSGLHMATERRVPPGPLLAETPTLFLMASRSKPRGKRPDVDSLPRLDAENLINPGHEVIAMLSTDGWTREEYDELRAKLDEFGYRTAVNINVLYEVGILERTTVERERPQPGGSPGGARPVKPEKVR